MHWLSRTDAYHPAQCHFTIVHCSLSSDSILHASCFLPSTARQATALGDSRHHDLKNIPSPYSPLSLRTCWQITNCSNGRQCANRILITGCKLCWSNAIPHPLVFLYSQSQMAWRRHTHTNQWKIANVLTFDTKALCSMHQRNPVLSVSSKGDITNACWTFRGYASERARCTHDVTAHSHYAHANA